MLKSMSRVVWACGVIGNTPSLSTTVLPVQMRPSPPRVKAWEPHIHRPGTKGISSEMIFVFGNYLHKIEIFETLLLREFKPRRFSMGRSPQEKEADQRILIALKKLPLTHKEIALIVRRPYYTVSNDLAQLRFSGQITASRAKSGRQTMIEQAQAGTIHGLDRSMQLRIVEVCMPKQKITTGPLSTASGSITLVKAIVEATSHGATLFMQRSDGVIVTISLS